MGKWLEESFRLRSSYHHNETNNGSTYFFCRPLSPRTHLLCLIYSPSLLSLLQLTLGYNMSFALPACRATQCQSLIFMHGCWGTSKHPHAYVPDAVRNVLQQVHIFSPITKFYGTMVQNEKESPHQSLPGARSCSFAFFHHGGAVYVWHRKEFQRTVNVRWKSYGESLDSDGITGKRHISH
jgi:hypothetical protein